MDTSVKELFDAGKQYYETKNYPRAEQYFLKILRQGHKFADVLNMLGIIYHTDGKFSSAIDCFEQALLVNPNYTEATLNLAVLYNDLGNYKKAKALYGRITKRAKTSAPIDPVIKGKLSNMHAHIGDTYRGIGFYKEAIDEYKKALGLNHTFIDIKTKLGVAYRENGNLKESLAELAEAVKSTPHSVLARNQLGVTFYSLKKSKEALQEWQQVLKRDPGNPTAKMYLKLCEGGSPKGGSPHPNGAKPKKGSHR
ncbi:MAG: tetratricopeptide repeat protein [Deltaproteobacteria bacterium]|nr:tetratricopeptide repeat protein [Deltaproteobacteria bacterium]